LSVAGRKNLRRILYPEEIPVLFCCIQCCTNTNTLSHILINELELFFFVVGRRNQGEYLDFPCGDTIFIVVLEHSRTLLVERDL